MRHIIRTNYRCVIVELSIFNWCSDQMILDTQGLLDNRTDTGPENMINIKTKSETQTYYYIIFTSVCTIWSRCALSILTV